MLTPSQKKKIKDLNHTIDKNMKEISEVLEAAEQLEKEL